MKNGRIQISVCDKSEIERYQKRKKEREEQKKERETDLVREWWRKRVRMLTPERLQHANNIRLLHSFIRNEPIFAEYYTDDLQKYFESFESKCEEGMFEELSDVCLFRHVGVDSNGLDLWIQLRGSNRTENVH